MDQTELGKHKYATPHHPHHPHHITSHHITSHHITSHHITIIHHHSFIIHSSFISNQSSLIIHHSWFNPHSIIIHSSFIIWQTKILDGETIKHVRITSITGFQHNQMGLLHLSSSQYDFLASKIAGHCFIFQFFCWYKKSGDQQLRLVLLQGFFASQVVQDFFHQQFHIRFPVFKIGHVRNYLPMYLFHPSFFLDLCHRKSLISRVTVRSSELLPSYDLSNQHVPKPWPHTGLLLRLLTRVEQKMFNDQIRKCTSLLL